jgi:hypothetical protein
MDKSGDSSLIILSSGWGRLDIETIGRGRDFKLWPGGGRSWDWSEHGTEHRLGVPPAEVEELIAKGCRVVILTTGRLNRLNIQDATLDFLQKKGIEVVVARTGKGIQRYNEYARKGCMAGGLFHSTC